MQQNNLKTREEARKHVHEDMYLVVKEILADKGVKVEDITPEIRQEFERTFTQENYAAAYKKDVEEQIKREGGKDQSNDKGMER